jgi:hypothetical protein
LVTENSLNKSTIQRLFKSFLKAAPKLNVYASEQLKLLIEGAYFTGDFCLVFYRGHSIKFTKVYRFNDEKCYEELKEDLEKLLLLGVQIGSIDCDGHWAILRAIRKVCSHVTLQRGVFQVQRICTLWLSSNLKSIAGQELRKIVSTLHLIQFKQEHS